MSEGARRRRTGNKGVKEVASEERGGTAPKVVGKLGFFGAPKEGLPRGKSASHLS